VDEALKAAFHAWTQPSIREGPTRGRNGAIGGQCTCAQLAWQGVVSLCLAPDWLKLLVKAASALRAACTEEPTLMQNVPAPPVVDTL
jgi:hypothetical protein